MLATTRLTSDDPLAALAADLDVPLVRGDEDDVLGPLRRRRRLGAKPGDGARDWRLPVA